MSIPQPDVTPIRTAVIDDEPVARRGICMLLADDPAIQIVGEAADANEAVELLERTEPDLVFLDVQMPGGDGFDVLRHVRPGAMPVVVFVTAYDEHAVRAFEIHAIDYLLKPYDNARFAQALARAKEELRRRRGESLDARLTQLLAFLQQAGMTPARAGQPEPTDRILVKSSGEIFFLKAEEIDWIEAEGDYMKFHVGGRTHLMRETMARLEARLDPKRFVRIHRSTIVNVDRLRKLSPTFAGEYAVVLHDGTKLRLSRGYHERIAALLKQAL